MITLSARLVWRKGAPARSFVGKTRKSGSGDHPKGPCFPCPRAKLKPHNLCPLEGCFELNPHKSTYPLANASGVIPGTCVGHPDSMSISRRLFGPILGAERWEPWLRSMNHSAPCTPQHRRPPSPLLAAAVPGVVWQPGALRLRIHRQN